MKKMRQVAKLLIITLAVLAINVPSTNKVLAATTSASYSTVNTDQSKKFSDSKGNSIKLKYYYKRINLKGSSAAVKKINKQLKSYSDKFLENKSSTYKYVKESLTYCSGQTFIETATSKVVYNKKGIISIAVTTDWYGGGVRNIDTYGYTFRLKDGKLLKITDVCGGTETNIKNAIWNKAKAAGIPDWNSSFTKGSISLSKVNFYVKSDSKVVVCFNSSDIMSNSSVKCTISRNWTEKKSSKVTSSLADGWYGSELVSKSQAKNNSYAKKYGFIYKMEIKGDNLIMYGSFSKDNKLYSSKKREFVISSSCQNNALSKQIINDIKDHKTLSEFFGFQIKNNQIVLLTFVS